jgi:hypothetical protein
MNVPGGNQGALAPNANNGAANIYMMKAKANLQTRDHNYIMLESVEKGKEAPNPLPPLRIEKIVGETMTRIHKGAFKKASHNPNTRAAQNYFVVEDLAQNPCVMPSLEVLQIFPSKRKALLYALGATKTTKSRMIVFHHIDYKPHLPHHVVFQIVVVYSMKSLT